MTEDVKFVLQLFTPIILGAGIWIVNNLRLHVLDIKQQYREDKERVSKIVSQHGERISKIEGKMNSAQSRSNALSS